MRTTPETTDLRSETNVDDSRFKLLDLEEDFTALKQTLQNVLERLDRLEATRARKRAKEEERRGFGETDQGKSLF